jgi:ribosome maturation factor RimP
MIDTEKIKSIAEKETEGTSLFVLDVVATPANEVEVTIDSDGDVDIDDCVALSRAIDAHFDREVEDFQLTVASAGVGYPLKALRQYKKLIGKPVEIVLKNGTKITAELRGADAESVTVFYTESRAVEGKKRKQQFEVEKTYPLSEIKTTKEYLDFK